MWCFICISPFIHIFAARLLLARACGGLLSHCRLVPRARTEWARGTLFSVLLFHCGLGPVSAPNGGLRPDLAGLVSVQHVVPVVTNAAEVKPSNRKHSCKRTIICTEPCNHWTVHSYLKVLPSGKVAITSAVPLPTAVTFPYSVTYRTLGSLTLYVA